MSLRQSRLDVESWGVSGERLRAFVRVAWPVLVVLGVVALLSPLVALA